MKKSTLLYAGLTWVVMMLFSGIVSAACDQEFYWTLRYNKQYTFGDDFNAGSSDKWIKSAKGVFSEQIDYNGWANPEFDWTDDIRNAKGKVPAWTTMSVLKAKSPYPIKYVPVSRSYDNLLITYTITYSTDSAWNNKYTHTECKHYEISRCGDGVVDSSYWEKCDPKDTSKTWWWNGWCDNSCNPVTAEQPVCNSTYNGQRLSNLTESANLCTKWTVSEFKYNESTHKWTWKCNNVAWQSTDCSATKPYCGDWTKDAWETCDPKDPNKTWWWNGWCDNSCNPVTIGDPVCNSSYNGQRVTSLVEWNYLCAEWTVSDFKYNESTHRWTWKCNNTLWKSTDCSATKPYCGDWTKDAWETCDPKDPNKTWWWNGWCDNSCNPITIGDPVCNSSYNGQRVTSLVEWNYLCAEWTVSEFKYNESTHKWTWKCNNTLWKSTDCSATKPYCGDWTKDAWETCDPKDPNKTWWGEEWCSDTCEAVNPWCGDGKKNGNEECDPKDPNKEWWSDLGCDASCHQITVPSGCDETFYETLRYGHKYTFYDDFHANVGDKWLWKWVMEYEEQYDYNKSPDFPQFAWTTDLVNANYRVASNTTMRVLQATSAYPILAVPAQRAYDNLFIKYTLTYSTDAAWNNKQAHSECAYYEISRCGDGVLDTEYDEICDPKDPNKTWWWNGWCDNSCNPITVVEPDWKLKIEKTLVWSKEVKNTWDIITWNIKVTAVDGNVTNFIVTDKLPDILAYDSYTVIHNPWLTVGNPTVNGNNIVWKVTWTLKEWEYLEIQLKTKAKWMPKEDIVNVACVRPENDPDEDCDEDDIPVWWKLKIEKTLVWSKEVKNVWDIITWNIKVTAVGGDVTNFIITDKLPEILWYSGYEVVHTWSVDSIMFGWENMAQNSVSWTVKWTLKENDYVEITLITYAKVMPEKDYKNVACVAPEDNPKDEDCDDEELPSPHIRIKKSFTDWSKTKTVKIWEEIGYKITFGNTGNASATITSIKDFLPKNVEYVTGAIFLEWQSNHENTVWGEIIDILRWVHYNRTVDGVYIDIYTWITLKPGESWYIILTGKILTWNQDSRTNFACIYLNDKKVDCDDATHDLWEDMCEKLDVPAWNLPSGWGSKDVTCTTTSGAVAEYIEIDCGNWASGNRYITWSNIKSLTGTCSYPSGGKTYNLVCKVKVEGKEYSSNTCKWTVTVDSPGGGCFPAWTKVIMANWSEKNIENVQVWDKVLSYNVDTNVNEVNVVNQRIVHDELAHEMYELTINGNVLKVTDVHPFYVRKSESSKNYDWIDAQNLKVWDILLMNDGKLVKIEKINHYPNVETVYNLEVDGNHDYFVDKWYLVHNKWWNPPSPSCFIAWTKVTMADGTKKNIEDVEIWEKVLWSNGTVNTVLGFHRPLLWEKELWSINGWKYFVTAEHPFMTTEWWKSLNPELTKIWMENLPVWLLKVGDTLITENWNVEIYSLDAKKSAEDTQLYNFKLDGDHTYYADNYLVHNKWWSGTPICRGVEVKTNGDVTCMARDSAYFKLQCGDETYYSHEKKSSYTFDNVKCSSNNVKCSVSKYEEEWPWTSNDSCYNAEVPAEFEQCFNVNAWNFSIEEWEIFPFFWNMHNLEVWIDNNKGYDYDWYDTIRNEADSYRNAVNNYEDYKNTDCKTFWTIAKDSMVCTFKIYGWWEKDPLYTIEWPCLSKDNLLKKSGLIKAWYNAMTGAYCGNSSKCYFSLDPDRDEKENRALLPSAVYYIEKFGSWAEVSVDVGAGNYELIWSFQKEGSKHYWEYRIVLDNVKYLQCKGSEENPTWQQTSPEEYFTPCQNNFVLTDSYTVQKTPSGNLTASTEKLSKYKYLNGSSTFSGLLGAISASEYTPNDNVNKAMKKFVDKYSKLAVSVNVWNSSFLDWKNIKKVPWKSIYFVDGDITINWGGKNINKPFTIVQTKGKTTIKWDVKHNMMLLTNGDIVFQWTDCTKDQTVKWIFYAGWKLNRYEKYRNNSSNATTWCTNGWLHVQWVLIWNNFNNLMENSRSHLNDWFTRKNDSDGGRSVVMNWASVLIEYSPSIFTKGSMPPGAEDFTTALSIYKN